MKKKLIIALAFSISAFSFAQKKELKTVEKAIKKGNFAEAKTGLKQVEGMMSSMDDEMKSNYHYLNSVALFANGAGSMGDINRSFESIEKVDKKYHASDLKELKTTMYNDFLKKADKAYVAKNYKSASLMFERAYNVQKKDTSYLYNAALLATSVPDYDRALVLFEKLKTLNYTGIAKQYFATDKASGEEAVLNKQTRDLYVKAGSHTNPGERLLESKKPEIVKNIALIYISQDNSEKAIMAIKDARAENPDNVDLIIQEANIYLKLDDKAKFKELIEQALVKDPENPALHYNVGVVSMGNGDIDSAQESFEKVLSIEPSNTDAALNLSNVYIERGNAVISEMGKLGMSKSDEVKYEAFKVQKNDLFRKGAEVLTSFMSGNPEAKVSILTQLKNIYNALGNTAKSKEIEAKIESMSGN